MCLSLSPHLPGASPGSPARKLQSRTESNREGQVSCCPLLGQKSGKGSGRKQSISHTPSRMHVPSFLPSSGLAALLRKAKGPVVALKDTRDRGPKSSHTLSGTHSCLPSSRLAGLLAAWTSLHITETLHQRLLCPHPALPLSALTPTTI